MRYYERRLPHWDIVGVPMFVTFRLHGSLPAGRAFPPEHIKTGNRFVALDRILDAAAKGPKYLHIPTIAETVVQALHYGSKDLNRYELHAWVLMANHVHLLVTASVPATKWLGTMKGFTAKTCNQLLGRSGSPFWAEESYDRIIRSREEFTSVRNYIHNNPMKAGLVAAPEDYRWSSAAPAESRRRAGLPALQNA